MGRIFEGSKRWKLVLGASSLGALVLHWSGLLETAAWIGIALAAAGFLLEIPPVGRRVSTLLSRTGRRIQNLCEMDSQQQNG